MLNFIEIGRTVVVMRERRLTQEKLALEAEMSVTICAGSSTAVQTYSFMPWIRWRPYWEWSSHLQLSEEDRNLGNCRLCDGEEGRLMGRDSMKIHSRTHIICCIMQWPTMHGFSYLVRALQLCAEEPNNCPGDKMSYQRCSKATQERTKTGGGISVPWAV